MPQVFGRYLLLRRLSRGGMGEIFLAKHGLSGFEKLCVIKKVLPQLVEDEDFIRRFVDEAQVAIKLQHANIAQVFEVGRVDNEYFLALEYVEGRDLRRVLKVIAERREHLAADTALFIAREVASGLSYAHRRTDADGVSLRLVHCDVSPPNVVISFEGEIKLIDFGIAKSVMRASATDPKLGFGKFGYMAPEQLVRGGEVDLRTDVYATGVILYEMLTGERLYELGNSPDYRALARMVTKGQHPLPSHRDPSLARYDELVARALRPDPADRYQSAAELRDAIQQALVDINPTYTHDHLGALVRRQFADEVREDRRLLAQAEATDLAPWADQLTHPSSSTVSFALADLPLQAPITGVVTRTTPVGEPRRRRRRVALWLVAGLLLAGGVAIGMWGSAGRTAGARPATQAAAAPAAAAPPSPAPALEVEPIHVETLAADTQPPVATTAPAAERDPSRKRPRPLARPTEPARSSAAGEHDAVTATAVHAKFQAVSREYRTFRASYGQRLEQEWTELATYAQYAENEDKLRALDHKIDQFRRQMRDATAGGDK